jgi:outer membrane protein assembly factor BamB
VLAGGHIYVTSEDGITTVFKAGLKFETVAENAVNEFVLSSIAVSDGQIFLRSSAHLYAIGQRRAAP